MLLAVVVSTAAAVVLVAVATAARLSCQRPAGSTRRAGRTETWCTLGVVMAMCLGCKKCLGGGPLWEGVTVEVQQACNKVVNMRACRSRASSGEQGQPKASFHCDGASEQAQCKYLYLNPEDQEKEAEQEQEQEHIMGNAASSSSPAHTLNAYVYHSLQEQH